MKDRFDLENEISSLHNFAEQLNTLSEGVLEHNLSNDEIANVLGGLKVLLGLHAEKLHDTMCQCFHLNQYNVE